MRRIALFALVAFVAADLSASPAMAQQGRRGQEQQQEDQAEAARKRARAREFEDFQAPLPGLANAGPCPYVKVLYDAARFVEFKGTEGSANVAYSGEIEGISATCAYSGTDPITLDMIITFSVGKGPKAESNTKTFPYWIAVTSRNREVLEKEQFAITAPFPGDKNTLVITDRVSGISIPRADEKVSGSNFEILVGFDVTPEMAQFNRDGKRFRIDAGATSTAAAGTTTSR